MPAIMKIKSAYSTLPTAERKVADFILKNPTRAPLMVINEIAEEVGVSVPSVTRLAKKLGYDGFLDFRVALASGSSAIESTKGAPVSQYDPDEIIIEKAFLASMRAIEDTLKALNKKDLSELANAIVKAKRIFLYGVATSSLLAQDIARQLIFLGYDAIAVSDPSTMTMYTSRFTSNDVFIGFSRTGRTKLVNDSLKAAKQRGSCCALVSNYINAPCGSIADYFFCTSRLDDVKQIVGRETNITMTAWSVALMLLVARKTNRHI